MRRMRQDWRMMGDHLESIRWGLEATDQQAAEVSETPSRGWQRRCSGGHLAHRCSSSRRRRHSRGVSEPPGKLQPAAEAAAAAPAIPAEAEATRAADAAATCQLIGPNRCSSSGISTNLTLARAPETSPEEPSVIEDNLWEPSVIKDNLWVFGRESNAASSTEVQPQQRSLSLEPVPESNLVDEHCMALELQLARANGCLASCSVDGPWPSVQGTPLSEDHSVNQAGAQRSALRRSVVTFADMSHFCSSSKLKAC